MGGWHLGGHRAGPKAEIREGLLPHEGEDAALPPGSASTLPVAPAFPVPVLERVIPAQALLPHKQAQKAVAFLYGDSSFTTQQLICLFLMRRMYLNLQRVINLRYSTHCQLCLPQTWGLPTLVRGLVAVLEKRPWGS
uniref:Uncharacterized protein n=1 Tax=Mustela putorius furo TaxID=9669 RepID=M3YWC4_MUSPF